MADFRSPAAEWTVGTALDLLALQNPGSLRLRACRACLVRTVEGRRRD